MNRLDWMAKNGSVPFELDFLRALGFRFGEDWDGEVLIDSPEFLDVDSVMGLVRRFEAGIKKRLCFERKRAMQVCVGGPMNGQRHNGFAGITPLLFHVRRAEWAVYAQKRYDDPRAWFVGMATSKKKARQLWSSTKTASG